MNQKLQKLGNPIFLFSLLVLILNDWFFKYIFHNTLTGKLSDFAGLLAFPFFCSTLFPKQIKAIHVYTFFLFIIWKSELSQSFIDFINYKTCLINRVVDYSDYIALLSIPLSYFIFNREVQIHNKPIFSKLLLIISCVAFLATSSPRHLFTTNKKYDFNFSKKELVQRFNKVQKDDLSIYGKDKNSIGFDSISNFFYFKHGKVPILKVEDYSKLSDNDTVPVRRYDANVHLQGNDSASSLVLINIRSRLKKGEISKDEKWAIKNFKFFLRKIKSAENF